jgi:hypothetical protein
MDSMMHLFIPAILASTRKSTLETPMVPNFIKEVWISSSIRSAAGTVFRGYGKSRQTGFNKYSSDITVWDGEVDERRLSVKGFQTTPLGTSVAGAAQARKICHSVEWKPDIDMLNLASHLPNVSLASTLENESYKSIVEKLQLASMLLVMDAIKELQSSPLDHLEGHHLKYYEWCQLQAEALRQDSIPHLTYSEWERYNKDEALKEELYNEVTALKADGALVVRMGKNIAGVIRQEVDPLNLMFGQEDNLLNSLIARARAQRL